jgi:hypothetical protein
MIQTVCRLLLLVCTVAACIVATARSARAEWDYCYGGPADCICYVRGQAHAFEFYQDYIGTYPSGGTIAASRWNTIENGDCEDIFDNFWTQAGPHWMAVSACVQYDADQAAEESWWYWNGSGVDWKGWPNTYWQGTFGLAAACCADLDVCN